MFAMYGIVSFEYNEEGLRTKKTATSTGETEYILHGKNITHMTQDGHTLHFHYDAQGMDRQTKFTPHAGRRFRKGNSKGLK